MNFVRSNSLWQNGVKSDNEVLKNIRPVQSDNFRDRRKSNRTKILKVINIFVLVMIGLLMFKYIDKYSLGRVINNSLPKNEAGLLSGILIGDKSGIGKEQYREFVDSGLVHIIVVSGSNVMLLVGGVIENLAGIVDRKKAIIFGLCLGWGYAAIAGWEIPLIRAILLVTIIYAAQLTGRMFNLKRAVIASVLIMVAADYRVGFSLSFWLSMLAFMGISLAGRKGKYISVKQTLWTSVFITPILAVVFGRISYATLLTNFIVIGLVEVLTIIGALGSVIGVFAFEAGKMVLWFTLPGLKLLGTVASLGSGGVVSVRFNWWMAAGWYMILFFVIVKNKKLLDSKCKEQRVLNPPKRIGAKFYESK